MKVLVIEPNITDPTSWYRTWGTFRDIRRRTNIDFFNYPDAFVTIGQQKGMCWPMAENYDIAILHRSFGEDVVKHAIQLKTSGVKLVYDIDDCLWEIPESFEIKKHYPKEILDSIDALIKICDEVWVSTQKLKEYIDNRLKVECLVIENGIDFNRYKINKFNQDGVVLWRGSSTHADDIRKYRDTFEKLARENHIYFWGYNPVMERPMLNIKDSTHLKAVDPSVYYQSLKVLNPKILLVPLKEDLFNECKSNIAYLEATMAGSIIVSNQWGEFKGKGFRFEDSLDDEAMRLNHEQSIQDVIDNYDLVGKNTIRIERLYELHES